MEYSFKKWQPFDDEPYIQFGIIVNNPFEYLSYLPTGYQDSTKVQILIDGIYRVKNGEEEDFYFRNEAGFLADMDVDEPGVYIFDEFSEDPTKELFIIPFDEMIKLLEDYKAFLIENGK